LLRHSLAAFSVSSRRGFPITYLPFSGVPHALSAAIGLLQVILCQS
jgi:hypothetical protein